MIYSPLRLAFCCCCCCYCCCCCCCCCLAVFVCASYLDIQSQFNIYLWHQYVFKSYCFFPVQLTASDDVKRSKMFGKFLVNSNILFNLERSGLDLPSNTSYGYFPKDYYLWIVNEQLYDINKPIVVIFLLLILLGIFGNSLVAYVFGFRLKKSTVHTYITCIAAYDTMTSILLIFEIFDKRYPMYAGNFTDICKVVRCLEVFFSCGSSLFIVSIAFDRYYKVCKPFKRLSLKTVRKSILCILIASAFLSWPMVLFHGPELVKTLHPGVSGKDCADDERFKDSIYPVIYFIILFVFVIACIVVIVIMYIFVFLEIFKWKHNSMSTTKVSGLFDNSVWLKIKSRIPFQNDNRKGKHQRDDPAVDCGRKSNNSNVKDANDVITFSNSMLPVDGDITRVSVEVPVESNTHQAKPIDATKRTLNLRYTEKGNGRQGRPMSRRNSGKKRHLSKTTITLSLIAFLYVMSYIPTIAVESVNAISPFEENQLSIPTRRLIVVCNAAHFINIGFNPIIYGVFNEFFRNEVRLIVFGDRK